jgi:hypothetical protein
MFTGNKGITHAISIVCSSKDNQSDEIRETALQISNILGGQPMLFALTHKMRQVHLGSSMSAR